MKKAFLTPLTVLRTFKHLRKGKVGLMKKNNPRHTTLVAWTFIVLWVFVVIRLSLVAPVQARYENLKTVSYACKDCQKSKTIGLK